MRSSRAIQLQQCGPYRWEGECNYDWFVHKSVEVNEYLVKAILDISVYNSLIRASIKPILIGIAM